jgi:hypothetical protein
MLSAMRDGLSFAPIWQIGAILLTVLLLGYFTGTVLRRRHDRHRPADNADGDGAGLIVSSVLGLMALLMAFTFAIAVDRFDTRRANVLNEANAIGTTYLRAQLLDAPHRERLSRILLDYVDTRLELASADPGARQNELLETNDALIVDLWTATVAAHPSIRSKDNSYPFLETMNQLIDMDAARKAGRQARVPVLVFAVLFAYQTVLAGLVGYGLIGMRTRGASVTFLVLLTLLVCLIIDLDRPTSGFVTESQQPMIQLHTFMRDQPPATFDRFSSNADGPDSD